MTYRVQVRWKVFSDIPHSTPLDFFESASPIFHRRTGKSLLREIGSNAKDTFVPLVLEPTHIFYNALQKVLQENNIVGKKLPFAFPLSLGANHSVSVNINIAVRLYNRVICVAVESDYFDAPDDADFMTIRQLDSHKELLSVVQTIVAIVRQGSRHPEVTGDSLRALPCLLITSTETSPQLSQDFLAEVVTGHPDVNSSVTNSLICRNLEHQIDKTTLLSDKQGVVFYAPPRTSAPSLASMPRRFGSATAMLELAAALQRLLKIENRVSTEEFGAIQQLVNNADIVFSNSFSGRILWNLFIREFKLSNYTEIMARKMQSPQPQKIIKVLCIAAAQIELKSIDLFLKNNLGDGEIITIGDGKNFDPLQCYFDKEMGVRWYLASQDAQGNASATADVGRLATKINPDHIIMVGMCMGLPHSTLKLGTVVIPDGLLLLDHQRATEQGTEYRPSGVPCNSGLQRLAKITSTEGLDFDVVFGKKLATASIKIEDPNSKIVTYLRDFAKDAVAFDMEGWGFYKAAEEFSCVWIKAVADSGEPQVNSGEKRVSKQETQAKVTTNAIQFAFRLIRQVAGSKRET